MRIFKITAGLSAVRDRFFGSNRGAGSPFATTVIIRSLCGRIFRARVLGHEMSREIPRRYFGVPAMVKVRETLSP